MVLILGIMLQIPGIQMSVYAIPVWLVVMFACYGLKGNRQARRIPEVNTAAK
ncbi:hypothetical protein D3C79_1100680 [compost metagenome]